MRHFGWFENEIWDASLHLFADRPVLTYDTYIEFLFKKKEAKRKFDVDTRYPRRARRNFPGTLDESLFLYLEFDKNKYLWNWGNQEALRKIGEFVIIVVIIYMLVLYGSCTALQWFCTWIWIFTVLFHTYYSQFVLIFFVHVYMFYLFAVCCCSW